MHGEKMNYDCEDGYAAPSKYNYKESTCMHGEWNNMAYKCQSEYSHLTIKLFGLPFTEQDENLNAPLLYFRILFDP